MIEGIKFQLSEIEGIEAVTEAKELLDKMPNTLLSIIFDIEWINDHIEDETNDLDYVKETAKEDVGTVIVDKEEIWEMVRNLREK